MGLPKDVYRLFESVVGPENISEDPAVITSYMYQPFGSKKGVWADIAPEAVILPLNTEEVVAIARICKCRSTCDAWTVFSRSMRRTCSLWSSPT